MIYLRIAYILKNFFYVNMAINRLDDESVKNAV